MAVAARREEVYEHYRNYAPARRAATGAALRPETSRGDYRAHESKKKIVRRSKKQVYVHVNTKDDKLSLFALISIFYVFAGVLICLMMYAVTVSKHEDILSAQNDLKHLKEYNASLSADISGSYDLAEIEKIATTKLGMSEPKAHQIIHISVPKQSYAVQNETAKTTALSESKRDISIINVIKDIFTKD